jgi:sterol 24-C-methyltransferase
LLQLIALESYYDLATDLYEEGWAQSFHFCRFGVREPLLQALARHEHYLAHKINLQEGMKVLDVGCGVGGPAREIASFSGCNVIGLNNNSYQISRAKAYAEKTGLSDKVSFVQGDFMVSKINLALFCASCREADYPTVSIESLT